MLRGHDQAVGDCVTQQRVSCLHSSLLLEDFLWALCSLWSLQVSSAWVCLSSYRGETDPLPAEPRLCSASEEPSAAAAPPSRSSAAARPREAGRGGQVASGRLSGPIRVLVRLRVSGPRREPEWTGLKPPRCPGCRRTDPDCFQRINPAVCPPVGAYRRAASRQANLS